MGAAGGYTNPVLDADWPDPDVIRVGGDYYLVASSFNRAPGLPILHSTDLISWELVSRALPALPPVEHYRLPRHGSGVWAPAIRHHSGALHIVYPDPDHGIFVVSAPDARGPWSSPRPLLAGVGVIDPCPLWDDDGRTYLIHAWALSRSGRTNRLTIVEVDAPLTRVVGPPRTVINGDELPGYRTLEGPKLYKRDGWYWIFAPAGGVATGWQSVFRARHLLGPYEDRVVLAQRSSDVNGPHQGAWVDTPDGEDWFVHLQDRGVFGRVVHLQPMSWRADGWPVIGAAEADDVVGTPVLRHRRPATTTVASPQVEPRRSDDFASTRLGLQWHWQANPGADWAELPGDGTLRLAVRPDDPGDLRALPRILGQPIPGKPSVWLTTVEQPAEAPVGTRAGIVVLGTTYAWVGLMKTPAGAHVVCRRSVDLGGERTLGQAVLSPRLRHVALRLECDAAGIVELSWHAAQRDGWQQLGAFTATAGRWVSADIGLFAAAPWGSLPAGRGPGAPGVAGGTAAPGPAPPRAIFGAVSVTLDEQGQRGNPA